MTSAWRVTSPPIDSTSRRMTPVSRSTAIEMWKSGRSPGSSVVRGWSHSSRIASRPDDDVGAADQAAAGREHVLAVAGRVDERVGKGLHRQRGDRLVDLRRAGQVRVVQAARAVADGALGAQAVGAGVRADDLAVGDPDLVFGSCRVRRAGRRDLRLARMAQHAVHRDDVLAARGLGPLLDAQAQRLEAHLGVAHEVEQLGDRRQGLGEGGDLGEPPTGRPDRDDGGAVPEAGLGHRRIVPAA